jgi:anti-anti-sigma regulatory factor
MLRITLQDGSHPSIRLEGKLSGPWVGELERTWNRFIANGASGTITLDLSEVTFVDSAGKKLLSALVERGAELRAAHLMTKYIVGQIIEGRRGSAKVGG